MKFSLIKLSMFLVVSISTHAISVDMDALSQKKQDLQTKYEDLKIKKQDALKKIKKAKNKLKDAFFSRIGNYSFDEKQELFVYLNDLLARWDKGSLEAYTEACEFFDTDSVIDLDHAIIAAIQSLEMPFEQTNISFELCKKYIGDDGLEYDDGLPDEEYESMSFFCLPLHRWEKKVIEKIIVSMAEKSLAQLLLDRKEMEKRGDQIHHVHPLRFMGYVMSDAYLKSCMNQFKNNSFKWSNFIDGYAQRMREEAAVDNLLPHIEGFCDFLKIEQAPVLEYVNKGNFEGLVLYLLQL